MKFVVDRKALQVGVWIGHFFLQAGFPELGLGFGFCLSGYERFFIQFLCFRLGFYLGNPVLKGWRVIGFWYFDKEDHATSFYNRLNETALSKAEIFATDSEIILDTVEV